MNLFFLKKKKKSPFERNAAKENHLESEEFTTVFITGHYSYPEDYQLCLDFLSSKPTLINMQAFSLPSLLDSRGSRHLLLLL